MQQERELTAASNDRGPPLAAEEAARKLLETARELALTLHPHRRSALRVSLDSTLDRDLGFDSLERVELLLRLERAFHVRLPETLLAEAETLRDLLDAALAATGRASLRRFEVAPLVVEATEPTPETAETLIEVLEWQAERYPDRPHVLLDDGSATTATIGFPALRELARSVGAGMRERGLEAGQSVAIMLPTGEEFFAAFFGALYAGGVPTPIYPPFRPAQLEDHLRRQAGILSNAQAAMLVTMPSWHGIARLFVGQVKGLRSIESVESLIGAGGALPARSARAQDTALLQYTSGSTGDPKGVVLSHANLLANIRAMGEALQASAADRFVSWLPLYHDMGLIGAWLGSLYYAAPVAIMAPLRFLARPENWLWAIHRYRATLTAAPNFAYELCLRKIEDADIAGLDLSSLRMAVNGAEAVSASTMRNFAARFARCGLRPTAVAPVYGLAECAVGLAFPPLGRLPIVDRVDRSSLTRRGIAVPAAPGDATALEFLACGRALPRHQIRILDPAGRELEDRHEGRLQFRGPSTTAGYFRNPEKTRELFVGDWLESGDLAYTVSGDVFITARSKDVIIRAGRNIYPQEVEEAVGDIQGVRKGCVVVFGVPDPTSGTERIIVVAETRERDRDARERMRRGIDDIVTTLLEAPADDVVLAAPHTVLKTSSGKIRRAACRALYEKGRLGAAALPVWVQVVRLRSASLVLQLMRLREVLAAHLYAGYWWGVLGLLAGVVWPLVVVLPGRALRWRIIRIASRLFFRLSGTPLVVEGSENIPPQGGVIVANHSSYFDNIVLGAVLRRPPVFVAKIELARKFFARLFLERIGTLFVERAQAEKGAEAAEQAIASARAGALLVFYPEGTLLRMPGLLPFRMGPFVTAAAAAIPVVPLAIRGTRSILRGDQWFPRRGSVHVTVARPIALSGNDWPAALAARDAARNDLLRLVGEPDLAGEQVSF